jgi:hypothetical protein
MWCSVLLWSGIIQCLVGVEAFAAANSHAAFFDTRPMATHLQRSRTPSALRTTATEVSGGGAMPGKPEGTATIPNEVFNLVKSIVGAGVLSVCEPTYVSIYMMYSEN